MKEPTLKEDLEWCCATISNVIQTFMDEGLADEEENEEVELRIAQIAKRMEEPSEEEKLVTWMERGCPVFLTEDDDIARPLGDPKLAVESLKRGLAAIDNIVQDGMVWRRKAA